jgi:hypothetical protein
MLLLACLLLVHSLVLAEIRSGGWRPIAPLGESGSHLAVSYHTLHAGGAQSLPLQGYHQLAETHAPKGGGGHDLCSLYKVSFVQDLYFQVTSASRGGKRFSYPKSPDRLWGPLSLLPNAYRGSFPEGKAARAWSWPLTWDDEWSSYTSTPVCLHGTVLN